MPAALSRKKQLLHCLNIFKHLFLALALALSSAKALTAQEVLRVAVASNFHSTAEKLAADFQNKVGHELVLIAGSSGKLATQIRLGMDIDVFLSADTAMPQYLIESGNALDKSTVYAEGRMILWASSRALLDSLIKHEPLAQSVRVAYANPKLAPYGRAAQQTIEKLQINPELIEHIQGENINQALQFAMSGNVDAAFLAASQVNVIDFGVFQELPDSYHQRIRQELVIIRDSFLASEFVEYLGSIDAQEVIRDSGYNLPPTVRGGNDG